MRVIAFLICCLAGMAQAVPQQYHLDAAGSDVIFTFAFEGQDKQGSMPVTSADIWLDLDDVPGSRVSVTLNAAAAKAGFVFATQAMKSPQVLHTDLHPTIRFRSTSFEGSLQGATVQGQLTVRGVTRPVTLKARLFRQSGTEVGDRRHLSVLLTGQIDRSAFGAGGYPGYVGPKIGLRITARINR